MSVFLTGNAVSKSYQLLMEQYSNILMLPLSARCIQLSTLIVNSSLKDLKQLYGILIEGIFGFRNKNDWNLLSLDGHYDKSDFDALRQFLAPDGILLQLAYKLSEDDYLCYSFPISCLPVPTSQLLYQGKISDFYSQKVSFSPDRQLSSSLQLNAFEFFLYHFTYFIINPCSSSKVSIFNSKPQDTLYESVLEDFLSYFLPNNSTTIPVCPTTLISVPSPTKTHSPPSSFKTSPNKLNWKAVTSPSAKSPVSSATYAPTATQKPHILKVKAFLGNNSRPNDIIELQHSSPEIGIYRSELFVEIITEMYLNQYSLEQPYSHFTPFIETFVPNHHHVWIIRVLIKHFHCFTNTSFTDNQGLRFPNVVIDPFSSLKSYLISKYVQKKLFTLLKIVFQHWPLDATFRAPLETWLSYIQPWRYSPKPKEEISFVDQWQKFIATNLLFYTPFFIQVLLRLFRMDLTTFKNSYMLFRVIKVFYENRLDVSILDAERGLGIGSITSSNVRGLHSLDVQSGNHTTKLQVMFQNLEFSLNNYITFFHPEVVNQVSRLLYEILSAKARTPNITSPYDSFNEDDKSFLAQVSSWFDEKHLHAEETNEDIKKVNLFLEVTAVRLCELFKIERETLSTRQSGFQSFLNLSSNVSTTGPIDENQNDQHSAIPKHLQQLNTRFTQKIIFQGNPDTQPVRTYEIESLVKFFGEISEYLNTKYAQQIQELYNKPSLFGRMCHQLFASPRIYRHIIKSKDMTSVQRRDVQLPPRILLRSFANTYVILKFIMALLFFYFAFNLHPVLCVLVFLFIRVFVIFIKAIFHLHKTSVAEEN